MANHRAAAALLLIASLFMAVAISGADARPTVRRDAHGQGYLADAEAPTVSNAEPTCDNCGAPEPKTEPPTCSTCESPKPEPESELTCNKVHGVQTGETCCSVGEGAGLTQDQFLGFNPNLCCEKLFVGQWVCLEATSGCHD
ncbi:unnamed protein product [Miscanthus lutarioriparius]|uniref:LysM domain-containing protein n=1 Tax=Miscanthus lutarioriparius TaxID=422564 RepID=A0A811P5V7_9POAL|nr:unnamed protein product [Miscanthus lutarioriparius]